MQVSHSAYYSWLKRPAKLITAETLLLYSRVKALFIQSRGSLGSRGLLKHLRKEGFKIGRYQVRTIMQKLSLKCVQRKAYKVTTIRKHSHDVADNVLKQNFTPQKADHSWAGDITYLRTNEGWLYLAIVMDLYSRRINGWALDKRMTVDLTHKAMTMAINLRQPKNGLVFHSDRGSQYSANAFTALLKKHRITPSMSGVGACWDNAVVERFFGSLKHEWLANTHHLTRETMKEDVKEYIQYYNQVRLHSANGDQSPIEFEVSTKNVSRFT